MAVDCKGLQKQRRLSSVSADNANHLHCSSSIIIFVIIITVSSSSSNNISGMGVRTSGQLGSADPLPGKNG